MLCPEWLIACCWAACHAVAVLSQQCCATTSWAAQLACRPSQYNGWNAGWNAVPQRAEPMLAVVLLPFRRVEAIQGQCALPSCICRQAPTGPLHAHGNPSIPGAFVLFRNIRFSILRLFCAVVEARNELEHAFGRRWRKTPDGRKRATVQEHGRADCRACCAGGT